MSKIPSSEPWKRRSQLSRILSNTGAVSDTELLMTFSTSEVAVCCSSASLVSLNRRTFWIAITAWSAKVWSSASCLVGKETGRRCGRLRSRRWHVPSRIIGDHRHRAIAGRREVSLAGAELPALLQHVADIDDAASQDRRAVDVVARQREREDVAPACGALGSSSAMATHRTSPSTARLTATAAPWNSRTHAADDRLEHRLHVGRRLADDAQDLGGRGLVRERFLGLVEQPRVLDRDHCLVGEGSQQPLFLVVEALELVCD